MPNTPNKVRKSSSIQPKSPAKRKGSPNGTGSRPKSSKEASQHPSGSYDARVTRSLSKLGNFQDVGPNTPKSPAKAQVQCKVCNWTGTSLLLHLKKKPQCAPHYDINALEAEAKQRNRDLTAARSRERYPEESPRKRTASREHYKRHTPEKQASMSAYNEKHRDDINKAMRNLNLDQTKREEKKETMRNYIQKIHPLSE